MQSMAHNQGQKARSDNIGLLDLSWPYRIDGIYRIFIVGQFLGLPVYHGLPAGQVVQYMVHNKLGWSTE